MKQILVLFCVAFICLMIWDKGGHAAASIDIQTDESNYVGEIKHESPYIQKGANGYIRLLVLKHSRESMADGDARLAIEAANLAKTKGLRIADIGNYYVNHDGPQRLVYDLKMDSAGLKSFISQQMKVKARPDDTFVIFTVGHGVQSGNLVNFGQRSEILRVIAEAAEENNQVTIWWQLSCYASANLPPITSLTPKQQKLLTVVASSDAHTQSSAYVEGKTMEKVFVAIATHDPIIDPNRDGVITAGNLRNFLNNRVRQGRGNLVYFKSSKQILFGNICWARRLPIIDHQNPNKKYPRDYILLPRRP